MEIKPSAASNPAKVIKESVKGAKDAGTIASKATKNAAQIKPAAHHLPIGRSYFIDKPTNMAAKAMPIEALIANRKVTLPKISTELFGSSIIW